MFGQDTLFLRSYVGNLKTIDVTISGKSYSFLFDTGGGETFISPQVANELNCSIYGQVIGFRMNGERILYKKCDTLGIEFGNQVVNHESVGIWDLMSILPEGLPRIDGVLSLKSFKDRLITIDLSSNHVIIEIPTTFKGKFSGKPISSRFSNGLAGNELTVFLAIIQHNKPYWFLMDSGNLDNLLLSHQTAADWNLGPVDPNQRNEFKNVAIALGKKRITTNVSSVNIIYDGVLNFEAMKHFKFHIDFSEKQVWISE